LTALTEWPRSGVPDNPGAWLTTAAKNRAFDRLRREKLHAREQDALIAEIESHLRGSTPDPETAADDQVGDDLLRLIFICCHPVLSTEARVALTLRILCGLSTDEIARAFLVPETTITQRITRAKRTLSETRVPFEVPRDQELAARRTSVLEVLYLVFNE